MDKESKRRRVDQEIEFVAKQIDSSDLDAVHLWRELRVANRETILHNPHSSVSKHDALEESPSSGDKVDSSLFSIE